MITDIPSALRLRLGALNVLTGAKTPFGAGIAAFPGSEEEAVECVALARQGGLRVVCAGGGAYVDAVAPLPPASLALSSLRLNRIVEHQPQNLMITAESGVTLSALQDALRRHRQFLPLNPPEPEKGTLGGIVAAAATGSWRASYGPVRDYLLEVRGVDGLARPIRGGARVMKNVAGYDLPKLYTASRGTLAFLTQVTFKVKPVPEQVARLVYSAASWDAIHQHLTALIASDVRPTIVEIIRQDIRDAAERPTAVITLEGSPEAVQWQITACTNLLRGEGAMIGRTNVATALPWGGEVEVTVRVKPTETFHAVRMLGAIGWRGAAACCPAEGRISLRCTAYPDTPELLAQLRAYAESQGGAVTVERMPRSWVGNVHPYGAPRADAVLGDAIKAKLDPDSVFGVLRPDRY
jgi:glycolate oxidase FAD binding subunit